MSLSNLQLMEATNSYHREAGVCVTSRVTKTYSILVQIKAENVIKIN